MFVDSFSQISLETESLFSEIFNSVSYLLIFKKILRGSFTKKLFWLSIILSLLFWSFEKYRKWKIVIV